MLKHILLPIFFHIVLSDVPSDVITSLPGIDFKINFKQYSGYLQPDSSSFMHYWLLQSQSNPATDPIVLWLNGGPGCSSMIGLFTENGPFRVTNINTTISENVYAWNKIANVLYLESPQRVGFSYTSDNRDTKYGDNETALLNYNSLKAFFSLYTEYNNRDFYITGESYGGVYLPTLAMYLIQDKNIAPNFKGMAIGNGLITNSYLTNTIPPLAYNHLLVGEKIWNEMVSECCNGNAMACDYDKILDGPDSSCTRKINAISITPDVNGMDPYNLYDSCYIDASEQNQLKMRTVIYQHFLKRRGLDIKTSRKQARELGLKVVEKTTALSASNVPYPDCYYDGITMYLGRSDVRKAINIPDNVKTWSECAGLNYDVQYDDMAQQLKAAVAAKVRVLVYNGDCDTVCNAIGDKQFLNTLGLKQISDSIPWRYNEDVYDVAGWQTEYEGLTFLSVRGSGHYVPMDKPREALQMITNFIRNKPYSTPTGINISPQPPLTS